MSFRLLGAVSFVCALSCVACGDGGSSDKAAAVGDTESSKPVGFCTVTGSIEDFKVACTKEIKSISMGGMTAGTGMRMNNVNITKVDAQDVAGQAPGQASLTFDLNHTDGSKSTISF